MGFVEHKTFWSLLMKELYLSCRKFEIKILLSNNVYDLRGRDEKSGSNNFLCACEVVNATVTVENEGLYIESFNVTIFSNSGRLENKLCGATRRVSKNLTCAN